jgi:hypothetical protein
MGLIIVIFLVSFFYARRHGPRPADDQSLPPAI